MTDANKAALAALFGITPERYQWLYSHRYCSFCGKWGSMTRCQSCGKDTEESKHVQSYLPDPLGPDADGVWLAPFMWWLTKHEYEPLIGGEIVNIPCWSCITTRTGDFDSGADTFTAALLQACLAAGVPEVCAAMEGEA